MRHRRPPLTPDSLDALAWDKMGGLLPALVQDAASGRALMLGYMNMDALRATLETGHATFWSRSKARLWTKGETSGNMLAVHAVHADCDDDALLVLATPAGPACHTGAPACWDAEPQGPGWLADLARVVADRATASPDESYTAKLLARGPTRVAQKVGEEGVELALAAATGDRDGAVGEAADLLFHMTVLMQASSFGWEDVVGELRARHKHPTPPRSG